MPEPRMTQLDGIGLVDYIELLTEHVSEDVRRAAVAEALRRQRVREAWRSRRLPPIPRGGQD